MKSAKLLSVLALIGITFFTSCGKEIQSETPYEGDKGNSQIRFITRNGSNTLQTAVAQNRIYIFDNEGTCVRMLSSSTESTLTAEKMPAGTYTIYAVGGDDLTKFTLPSQSEATATSVIQLASGKAMGDLLMTSTQVTLNNNQDSNQELTLLRKVFSLNSITIRQVPDDVTSVEVSVEPLYNKIQLNGTFVDETERKTFALTEGANGTWSNTTEQLLFPSKGQPTITIHFTRSGNTTSYSYTASAAIEANHHFAVEGSYTEVQGVTLSASIISEEWGNDRTITFNFNEANSTGGNSNPPSGTPVVGSTYLGCYVVAVNGTTATLVSPTEESGFNTSENNQEGAITLINSILGEWSVTDVTGTWRLPTIDEVSVFVSDPNYLTFDFNYLISYYINDAGTIKSVDINSSREVSTPKNYLGGTIRLRPVIDITY